MKCAVSMDRERSSCNGIFIVVHQEQLLLTYSAHSSSMVNFYPQVLALPNQTLFSQLPGTGSTGYRIQTSDTRASQQIPLTLTPTLMARLNCQQYQGLVSAASILGGPTIFLYLFARVKCSLYCLFLLPLFVVN